MHDVLGVGMLREWLAHWSAQLPVLVAATAMFFAAATIPRYRALIRVRHGRTLRIGVAHAERFVPRRLRGAL
ncbi:MAG: hypothetical protein ABSE20_03570 [Acetobacteraceae bacterium]|jgi:hypothetical protein